ncbi:MAG: hypothetical protein A2042_06900 [Candidatus Schekmanbacteria bacterium GWA2_38_11]|uniref:Serine dehydratase-like alpha subunit domain-containing protein n=1 Tax=Candidatus Schekmanbacteria bacterium GWA2_38_11 TaxID=1817876 RepID=A0A1F7RGL9_9BACT|nr:MAG: hypothetical protein A2042_06900 [Candidatus Schekmanbacteria bacterium GWA2_38_11]
MNLSQLLRKIVIPVTGCTEPTAVGLATSAALTAFSGRIPCWITSSQEVTEHKQEVIGDIESIPELVQDVLILVDRNVYKNALSVGIPNTGGKYGLSLAGSLGLFCNPDLGMNLFTDVNKEKITLAKRLIGDNKIKIATLKAKANELFIKASVKIRVKSKIGTAKSLIRFYHNNFIFIEADGKLLYEKYPGAKKEQGLKERFIEELSIEGKPISAFTVSEIYRLTKNLTEEDKQYILDGLRLNLEASKYGLEKGSGLGIGKFIRDSMQAAGPYEKKISRIKSLVAAASDARMAGENVRMTSSSGSGNMGALITLSIYALAEETGLNEKLLAEAITLAHLITAYLTSYIGVLSPLCGSAAKGGIGAAAGMAYYMGADEAQVSKAMKNMISALSGVICDGAKLSCALKVGEAAGVAYECASLALKDIEVPFSDGIAGKNIEETINNLSQLSHAMDKADSAIIKLMSKKAF